MFLVLVRNARGSRLALFDLYCDTPRKPIYLVRPCTNIELIITKPFFKPPDFTVNPVSQETLERSDSGYISIRRKIQEVGILQKRSIDVSMIEVLNHCSNGKSLIAAPRLRFPYLTLPQMGHFGFWLRVFDRRSDVRLGWYQQQ